ncbi:MAG: 3'(2'),5'-bisphosphate nucleotidase CysQ [Campylobacterota bacterium]|nr:3'(2'),5'-bisphosphate nucleotidase CysQ [Campylobacterota bacterium]
MLDQINLDEIVGIAKEAGDAIMDIYEKDFSVEYKDDKSPLTEADLKSNEIICNALTSLYPDIPILSEENKAAPYTERKSWDFFWLIDPIDGTKEFIKKNGEFTVNIALIHKDTPVLGVVYAPVLEDMYSAKKDEGAFKNEERLPLKTNAEPEKHLSVVASKSHLSEETQEFIDELALGTEKLDLVSKGSSLKLCMVAEGTADIYPRLAPTMEWDTGAAHAVVLESGKQVVQFENNKPVVYNKENLLNPWFIVRGK